MALREFEPIHGHESLRLSKTVDLLAEQARDNPYLEQALITMTTAATGLSALESGEMPENPENLLYGWAKVAEHELGPFAIETENIGLADYAFELADQNPARQWQLYGHAYANAEHPDKFDHWQTSLDEENQTARRKGDVLDARRIAKIEIALRKSNDALIAFDQQVYLDEAMSLRSQMIEHDNPGDYPEKIDRAFYHAGYTEALFPPDNAVYTNFERTLCIKAAVGLLSDDDRLELFLSGTKGRVLRWIDANQKALRQASQTGTQQAVELTDIGRPFKWDKVKYTTRHLLSRLTPELMYAAGVVLYFPHSLALKLAARDFDAAHSEYSRRIKDAKNPTNRFKASLLMAAAHPFDRAGEDRRSLVTYGNRHETPNLLSYLLEGREGEAGNFEEFHSRHPDG